MISGEVEVGAVASAAHYEDVTSPEPGPLLSEYRGVVAAPVSRVRQLVFAVTSGEFTGADVPLILDGPADRRVVITDGPEVFRADVNGAPLTVEINYDADWVQARGGWWWCRRLHVDDGLPGHTEVRQQTFNCASGLTGKLVPFTVGRGHRAAAEKGLRRLLDGLSQRLGCAAWVLPDASSK